MKTALLVIDVQNEYFAGDAFPQENATEVAQKIAAHIQQAQADGQFVIGVQHVSPEGEALFARGSYGGALHASVSDLLVDKPLVQKTHADCFLDTNLTEILMQQGIEALDICGIMTQNSLHIQHYPPQQKLTISAYWVICVPHQVHWFTKSRYEHWQTGLR